ncbi:Teneurin-4, partial [Saguinus oedipus]
HACVIRGQVMTSDGTPLVGVNISFVNNPLFGYTVSRQDGRKALMKTPHYSLKDAACCMKMADVSLLGNSIGLVSEKAEDLMSLCHRAQQAVTVQCHVDFVKECIFDLVTNGGISIILRFERAPFITQEHTLWLPWDRFFVMETIIMRHEENEIPSCDLSNFARPNPVVSPSPLTSFASSCAEKGPIVPEIQ